MIMGILNITPDSFSDGGKYLLENDWLLQTKKMVDEGADIIDIGGFSTRPGAAEVSAEEEEGRIIPVIKSVRKHFRDVIISVDTFRAAIAEKAVEAGANIINDVSGGMFDEAMFATVAKLNVPYILMHNNSSFKTMHDKRTENANLNNEIIDFFKERISKLKGLGFSKIILDPGFGFGKTQEQNYGMVRDLGLQSIFEEPFLVGVSRKSMVTKLFGIKAEESVAATSVVHVFCLLEGARILRVHDVKEAKQTVELVNRFKR